MVSENEVKKSMDVLGITDVHVEFTYVKKVHKKLLLKWHPDSCPEGKTEEYTKRSAEINAAFDVLEKAYKIGMLGPGVKDFREASSERANDKAKASSGSSYAQHNSTSNYNSTNGTNNGSSSKNTNSTASSNSSRQDNTTNSYSNNNQNQNEYDTYSYYRDLHERQRREYERREYERRNNRYLLHNAVWNFIFYAICINHIYRTFTEIDLGYKNMYIKETPYYFSVLIVVFYILKLMYVFFVLDGDESEHMINFCKIYIPIAFVYPIVYTFLNGVTAAIVFSVYFAGWAVFEWLMNIKIYENLDGMSIGTIRGKKVPLPFIFFGLEEMISIAFGVYVAITAIFIK